MDRIRSLFFPLAAVVVCAGLLAFAGMVGSARGDTLSVRVYDARSGSPMGGAFVQVGQAPGDPFSGNSGSTGPDGKITFSNPLLVGPQTVTAGYTGYSLLTIVESAVDSIALGLTTSIAPTHLPPPKSQVSGTVTGIQVKNNDGNLDVGMVYPAVHLADLLSTGTLPFEVPADTVNFPIIGNVVLPGNIVVPTQTEGFIFVFSKPNYHFYVPSNRTYDFITVAGRLPVTSLTGQTLPFDAITMRQVGAQRNVPVTGDLNLTQVCDLNLAHTLNVNVPEAPNGSIVWVGSVAQLPGNGSPTDIFYDAKNALRDTLTTFHMSGLNSTGELSDATPFLAGYYGDSSSANTYQSGRIDRSPLTLPTTRTLGSFFLVPSLTQQGDQFSWTNVARPGVTPNPTWAMATFRVQGANGDTSVTASTDWQAWVPAGNLSFRPPVLPSWAPGGLPDPSQIPSNGELVWDLWLADPSGGIQSVMTDPFSSTTTFSRREIQIESPVVDVAEFGLGTLSNRPLKFRVAPNPGRGSRIILWDHPPGAGQPVAWSLWDAGGRRVAYGGFRASGATEERPILAGLETMHSGVYWIRLRAGEQSGAFPVVVSR